MKAFRFMYENRYGNLEIPDRVNGKHTELIDILMKEPPVTASKKLNAPSD